MYLAKSVLSSYMHNFVKKNVENQNPYNMHTLSVGTNCLHNIKGLAKKTVGGVSRTNHMSYRDLAKSV